MLNALISPIVDTIWSSALHVGACGPLLVLWTFFPIINCSYLCKTQSTFKRKLQNVLAVARNLLTCIFTKNPNI